MTTVKVMRGTYRWGARLYQLTGTWTEKFSLAQFLVKFVLVRFIPEYFHQEDIALSLHGTTYIVGLRTTEVYTIEELCDDHDYDRSHDFIPRAGWTVFDVGANVGMFAMQQAQRKAHVYAFEPNPDCYRRLLRAIVENRLASDVSAFNYAVGSAPGSGIMLLHADQTTAGSVIPLGNSSLAQGQTIKITSLDLIVPALGVTRINLLKIDVEGAEVEVLHGATRTLDLVDRVVLEYHSLDLQQQVRAILNEHGFMPVLQIDTAPQAGVGLLYAKRVLD